ncbi:UPF0058 family protein [Halogeometricum borinquense]|uniref:UPF0058 family protein n=1 Tax=Halogeometricum borinquense TaxID=60847 RepID=UPI001EF90149|nr:UPF0058 family protein [Halogeometricum borinquense]
MRKNEIVHIHALLVLIAEKFVGQGLIEAEEFAEYRLLGTSPMSLRAPRADHEAAVRLLADTLSTAVERYEAADHRTDGSGRRLRHPSSRFY